MHPHVPSLCLVVIDAKRKIPGPSVRDLFGVCKRPLEERFVTSFWDLKDGHELKVLVKSPPRLKKRSRTMFEARMASTVPWLMGAARYG